MNITETPLVAAAPWPERLVRASLELLRSEVAPLRQHPHAVALARAVLRGYAEHRGQLEHAAGLVGADLLDVTLANLSYDALMGTYGCSTLALATPDGPVVARNMDWCPEGLIARASCVMPTAHGHSAGPLGCVGVVTGLSSRGFAVVLNAVGCGQLNPAGYPVLLFLRHLLDHAADFGDALRLAELTPLLSSALITLVGTRNGQRAVVERTPTRAAVRRPRGGEALVTTNHYLALAEGGAACERYQALTRWARHLPETPSPDDLLALLTRPPVFNEITAQHIVIHPAAGWLRQWVPAGLLERGGESGHGDWVRALLG